MRVCVAGLGAVRGMTVWPLDGWRLRDGVSVAVPGRARHRALVSVFEQPEGHRTVRLQEPFVGLPMVGKQVGGDASGGEVEFAGGFGNWRPGGR